MLRGTDGRQLQENEGTVGPESLEGSVGSSKPRYQASLIRTGGCCYESPAFFVLPRPPVFPARPFGRPTVRAATGSVSPTQKLHRLLSAPVGWQHAHRCASPVLFDPRGKDFKMCAKTPIMIFSAVRLCIFVHRAAAKQLRRAMLQVLATCIALQGLLLHCCPVFLLALSLFPCPLCIAV